MLGLQHHVRDVVKTAGTRFFHAVRHQRGAIPSWNARKGFHGFYSSGPMAGGGEPLPPLTNNRRHGGKSRMIAKTSQSLPAPLHKARGRKGSRDPHPW